MIFDEVIFNNVFFNKVILNKVIFDGVSDPRKMYNKNCKVGNQTKLKRRIDKRKRKRKLGELGQLTELFSFKIHFLIQFLKKK